MNTLNLKEHILNTVIWKCFHCHRVTNNDIAYENNITWTPLKFADRIFLC